MFPLTGGADFADSLDRPPPARWSLTSLSSFSFVEGAMQNQDDSGAADTTWLSAEDVTISGTSKR